MKDSSKTKKQLIKELEEMRQRNSELGAFGTRYLHVEQGLKKNEQFFKNILNSIQDGVSILDNNLNILYVNQTMEKWYPHQPRLVGKSCYDAYHGRTEPCEICPSIQTLSSGKEAFEVVPLTGEDGVKGWLELFTFPLVDTTTSEVVGVIEYVRDISKRKIAEEKQQKLQSQLIHSQKMESIGRLAGGVAHDFNNILSAILGYSELAMLDLPEESPLWEPLSIIKDSGKKGAALTRQLLAFSRKQILEITAVDLNSIITNTAKMLRRLIGEDILLDLHLTSSTRNVMTDASQIEQVIMNLAVNARDAMPSGGLLAIETEEVILDESEARQHEGARPGPYVMFSVTDTGEGMRPEVKENIFDPFFTTKGMGKGTGLGLSTVYGIITQHNGFITVETEPGKGTTFKVFLPVAEGDVKKTGQKETSTMQQGTETILVVDDDPFIRKLVVDILEPLGYHPLGAAHGKEALSVCKQFGGNIDLLLTDVVMPEMNGKELADAFLLRYPETKVIFMSGYTDDTIEQHGVIGPGIGFIQKPLTPFNLTKKLREVLDEDLHG